MADAQKFPQITTSLAASLAGFVIGNIFGWISPAIYANRAGQFGVRLTYDEFSWVGSCLPLFAAIFVVPVAFIINRLGSKQTALLLNIPIICGWIFIILVSTTWSLYVGRLLHGMGVGGLCLTIPLYICEIAQKEIRGLCVTLFTLLLSLGILVAYLMAFVNIKVMSLCMCAFSFGFYLIFVLSAESPIHLVRQNRDEEASEALKMLRGNNYDDTTEMKEIKENDAKVKDSKLTFFQAIWQPSNRKALLIVCGLMFFQQLCGVDAVIVYMADIFLISGSEIATREGSIIIAFTQAISMIIPIALVDVIGRRILLILSGSFMALSTIVLGVYIFLEERNEATVASFRWMPLVCLCLFVVMYAIGFGPLPWLMMGELFAGKTCVVSASIATLLNWFLAFIVTKTFMNFQNFFGTGPTFWLYSANSIIGVCFVIFVVIETKKKSLNEIQDELAGKTE